MVDTRANLSAMFGNPVSICADKYLKDGEKFTIADMDIEFILNKTYEFGIMSILVEAGGKLNGAFLDFTDKIYQFIAPKIVGDNTALSCFDYRKVNNISDSKSFSIKEVKNFPPDILLTLIPNT